MKFRKTALQFHRWASLACLAFWFVQALTGVLIVFHWEASDALISGSPQPVDLAAIERRIDTLQSEGTGRTVGSVWESGGTPGRFDLYLDAPEGSSTVRIDGAGQVLRQRGDDELLADGGWVNSLVLVHHNLMSGDIGSWIVGISGLMLISNIALGLVIAWPRSGQWRRALLPRRSGSGTAGTSYAWHRALGLWGAIPALMTVCAGVMLVFSGALETVVKPPAVEAPQAAPSATRGVGFAAAVAKAMQAYPGASLSGVSLPGSESAFYRVRLLQPGESRRVYGTTTVYVRAADGTIAARYDALDDGPARSFMDGLFPFHTGEMGGTPGRLAVMAIGLWLLTMIALGFTLWRKRSGK